MTPGPAPSFDRDDVLCRAMGLFWEQGYEATGLAQLLERLGIARQSLYNTFGDKKSLFLEALDAYDRRCVQEVVDLLNAPGSPIRNLTRYFEGLAEKVAEGRGRGCLLGRATAELGATDPDVAARVARSFDRLEDAFFALFERAKGAGELTATVDSRDLSRLFVNALQGTALMSQVRRDPEHAKSVTRSLMALLPLEKRRPAGRRGRAGG